MLLGPHGLFEIIEVEAKQSRAKGATLLHPHDRLEGSRLAMRRVDYHRYVSIERLDAVQEPPVDTKTLQLGPQQVTRHRVTRFLNSTKHAYRGARAARCCSMTVRSISNLSVQR